jgi:hypothetical protein
MVFSSEVPTEAPSCWPTVTVAEATPASCGAEQVGQPAAEQQQATERQGVRRHDPLPVRGGEAQRVLRGRQGDVHHRDIQDDHELREADHAEDEPPPPVPGAVGSRGIRHDIHASFPVVTACASKY